MDKLLIRSFLSALALLGTTLLFTGCADDDPIEDAAEDTGDALENAAENTEDAAEDAADEVRDATN